MDLRMYGQYHQNAESGTYAYRLPMRRFHDVDTCSKFKVVLHGKIIKCESLGMGEHGMCISPRKRGENNSPNT